MIKLWGCLLYTSYTSAKLTTAGKADWQYGKVQVRAKLPKGKGSWPAIWMMPNDCRGDADWPLCGEIDIMEHVGWDQNRVHATIHSGLYNHRRKTQRSSSVAVSYTHLDVYKRQRRVRKWWLRRLRAAMGL